jgi:hypothetical protein
MYVVYEADFSLLSRRPWSGLNRHYDHPLAAVLEGRSNPTLRTC